MLSEHNMIHQKPHQASPLMWSVHRRQSSPRWAIWDSEWSTLCVFCHQNFVCACSHSSSARTESLIQTDKCPRELPLPRTVESGSSLEWPEGVKLSARVKHEWTRPAATRASIAHCPWLADAPSPVSSPVARWMSVRGRTTTRPWSPDDLRHSALSDDPSPLNGKKSLSGCRVYDTHTSLSLEEKIRKLSLDIHPRGVCGHFCYDSCVFCNCLLGNFQCVIRIVHVSQHQSHAVIDVIE